MELGHKELTFVDFLNNSRLNETIVALQHMKSLQDLLDHLKKYPNSFFWESIALAKVPEKEASELELWRDAILENTDPWLITSQNKFLLAAYNQAIELFGQSSFNADLQQFFDDNKDQLS